MLWLLDPSAIPTFGAPQATEIPWLRILFSAIGFSLLASGRRSTRRLKLGKTLPFGEYTVSLRSDAGIAFSATYLDYYTEATWTPADPPGDDPWSHLAYASSGEPGPIVITLIDGNGRADRADLLLAPELHKDAVIAKIMERAGPRPKSLQCRILIDVAPDQVRFLMRPWAQHKRYDTPYDDQAPWRSGAALLTAYARCPASGRSIRPGETPESSQSAA
jgi:hypothetical protein